MHAPSPTIAPRPLAAVAGWLSRLSGGRRFAVAVLLGGLAALALPPAGAVPVLLAAFPGLLWLLDGCRSKRAAYAVGWAFAFGHHLLGLYWISFALFTDIGRFWWALPLSAAGLPIVLAFFGGAATLGTWVLGRRGGLARVVLFAVLWTVCEWLRGHLFTGFPWNAIGYGWVDVGPVLQIVSVTGIYGLSLLTVLLAAVPAALPDPRESVRRVAVAAALGAAVLAGVAGWGAWRMAGNPTAFVPDVRLRLVQAAIDQRLKWAPGERENNVIQHLDLSAQPPAGGPPPTHVIWPETAVPFFVDRDVQRRMALAAVTPPGGLVITGAPRAEGEADGSVRYFNSMIAVDGAGSVRATYDKAHLVPFGEYMPLRRWLPVGAIAGNGAEFSAGPGPRTLHLPGLPPVSPLICYEVIFPAAVTDPADRPGWMLNLTNDAWYGNTAGPHQHFAIARVRAVEEGVPLVRSANTGISGVIDPVGRVTAVLALGQRGIVDAALPQPLSAPTLYALYGDGVILLLLLSAVGVAFVCGQRR
ncbi:apolipoprotein N-acyltransferase [Azospirillum fermentarium]|uniref:apolipoprotein N-acyltransferase n=1 Tax=Azospirillum fermentarium TaxID=1233114 RepID=UPI0022279177|nr:apolipoprotein N-acyltransferase [Azospirillum fermentarium]MCW2244974.1 apolipoprotein N-acyltransferase [Azospirillum fermentarium]